MIFVVFFRYLVYNDKGIKNLRKMKKLRLISISFCTIIMVLICIIQPQILPAQSRLEYGFTVGPSNFLGDLGGGKGKGGPFLKDNMIPLTRLMAGVHVG